MARFAGNAELVSDSLLGVLCRGIVFVITPNGGREVGVECTPGILCECVGVAPSGASRRGRSERWKGPALVVDSDDARVVLDREEIEAASVVVSAA